MEIVLSPNNLFENIKNEKGITRAFIQYAFLSFLYLSLSIVVQLFYPINTLINSLKTKPILLVLYYTILLISSFIWSSIVHLFAKLFGGNGDYSSTYRALTYSLTPFLILGWIPFLGIIFVLYSLYLSVLGISKLHEVSIIKAVITLSMPIILTIILAGISYVYISSLYGFLIG
jgi:hypothetical protein